MARFTQMIILYVVVGVVVTIGTGGTLGGGSASPVSEFLVDTPDGNIEASNQSGSGDGGLLDGIFGPLQEGSGSVSGGGLVSAMNMVISLLSYAAWPLTITYNIGAPWEVQMVAGMFMVGLIVSTIRVLKGSA